MRNPRKLKVNTNLNNIFLYLFVLLKEYEYISFRSLFELFEIVKINPQINSVMIGIGDCRSEGLISRQFFQMHANACRYTPKTSSAPQRAHVDIIFTNSKIFFASPVKSVRIIVSTRSAKFSELFE